MANVKFTNDLSPENRKNGEFLLGYYWRNSPMSKAPLYPVTNWHDLIVWLDSNYPTYIEALGELMKSAESSKLIQAMTEMGKNNGTAYPRPSEFSNYISEYAGQVSISQVLIDAGSQSVQDIAALGLGYAKIVFIVGALVLGIVLYQKSGGKMPKIKVPKLA